MKTVAVCASSSSSAKTSPPSAVHECRSTASSAAGKHRRPGDQQQGDEEMQACFARLMQLVPTVAPTNGRMSKVQLLQHVIDYILDLEYTLDFRPNAEASTGKAENADRTAAAAEDRAPGTPSPPPPLTAPSPQLTVVERKPLTENAQVNSSKGHHSLQQQTSYFERQPSITWS